MPEKIIEVTINDNDSEKSGMHIKLAEKISDIDMFLSIGMLIEITADAKKVSKEEIIKNVMLVMTEKEKIESEEN